MLSVLALTAAAHADPWTTETFTLAPDDYIAASLAQGAFPSAFPSGVGTLDEPAVSNGLLLAGKIRDASGEVVGFATEQASIDFATLVSHSTWTLTFPDRGTLFLSQDEDIAPLFQVLGEMMATGQYTMTWDPAWHLVTTLSDSGVIVGGTGEFEDARGTFREVDDVHVVSLATGALSVTDTLEITLKTKD
jgi:hypothetical protein